MSLKSFVEQASRDMFGLKIKLPNGNVASRILPVQIHDLYPEDRATIEKELGGVLRAVEFIYKEPGVNRPLTAADDKDINLNKTKYRNQINKVAIAIEEVIHGLRSIQNAPTKRNLQFDFEANTLKDGRENEEKTGKHGSNKKFRRWVVSALMVITCIAVLLGILKVIGESKHSNDISKLEKSIAVLPFVNDSPDHGKCLFHQWYYG